MFKLWIKFLLNGKWRIVLSFLVILALSFLDLSIFVQCQQKKVTDNMIFQSDFLETDMVGLSFNACQAYRNDDNKEGAKIANSDLLETLHMDSSVEKVYGFDESLAMYGDTELLVRTAYPETYELMSKGIHLSSGKWFGNNNDPNTVYCVVSGSLFADVNIGDQICINSCDKLSDEIIGSNLYCTVAGKVDFPYDAPVFNPFFVEANEIIHSEHSSMVYLLHNETTVSALQNKDFIVSVKDTVVFVKYKQDTSSAAISKFRSYISSAFINKDSDLENIAKLDTLYEETGEINTDFSFLTNKYFLSSYLFMSVLISAIIMSLIMSAAANADPAVKKSANLFSVIATDILMVTIPSLLMVVYWFAATLGRVSSNSPASQKAAALSCSQTTETFVFLLILWLLTLMLTMIAPIYKLIHSWKDSSKEEDAYTYRPPVYYQGYETDEDIPEPNRNENNNP